MSISATQREVFRCVILFFLPLLGAAATMYAAQIYVSHDDAICHLSEIQQSVPTLSGRTIAASYYLAVANAIVVLISLATLIFAFHWMVSSSSSYVSPQMWPYMAGVAILSIVIALSSFYCRGAVDDNVARTLFALTYKRAIGIYEVVPCHPAMDGHDDVTLSGLQLGFDARWLGFLVFSSYLISATIVAFVAGSRPARMSKEEAEQRLSILNAVLFSMAALLVAAMITAKFRFGLGLATLNPSTPANGVSPAYTEYQVTANAIASYMAAVQSVFLALLYVPGTMLLSPKALIIELNGENFARLAKLFAIFSPPIVTKLVDVFSSAPS